MKTKSPIKIVYGKAPAWAKAAEKVFKDACRDAIKEHFAVGNPVYVQRGGKLMKLEPKRA